MSVGGRWTTVIDFTLSEGLVLQWKHMNAFIIVLLLNTPVVELLAQTSVALSYLLAFWHCVRGHLAYI